ncbi:uncharacterized protein [Macrobrachium rosenbergii]|uniref:uncharacterized protein isoform X2 n=1 Tax=Macrobrachium rosenbergii TaxID=79674 RepID=UPI0034D65C26
MLNSAGIQSDECTLTAESLLTSIRNMERMLTSLQSSHMADRTQDELACTARKMLAAFSNVATGTATLTENEKEEVQLILNNLSQHKFKELSKSLAESQKSKEALKRSLESHLEDLASRKRQVEDALAVAKSR